MCFEAVIKCWMPFGSQFRQDFRERLAWFWTTDPHVQSLARRCFRCFKLKINVHLWYNGGRRVAMLNQGGSNLDFLGCERGTGCSGWLIRPGSGEIVVGPLSGPCLERTQAAIVPSRGWSVGASVAVTDEIPASSDGSLLTPHEEAIYAYSGYEGCPWLVETRHHHRIR